MPKEINLTVLTQKLFSYERYKASLLQREALFVNDLLNILGKLLCEPGD
jgi:hypothetical protein